MHWVVKWEFGENLSGALSRELCKALRAEVPDHCFTVLSLCSDTVFILSTVTAEGARNSCLKELHSMSFTTLMPGKENNIIRGSLTILTLERYSISYFSDESRWRSLLQWPQKDLSSSSIIRKDLVWRFLINSLFCFVTLSSFDRAHSYETRTQWNSKLQAL